MARRSMNRACASWVVQLQLAVPVRALNNTANRCAANAIQKSDAPAFGMVFAAVAPADEHLTMTRIVSL